ncbi:response regulator [Ramlibacter albus]|uniref:Response regulator n=1 Tax=Ramlibacter albus TaxID=2079448 RepID=A0A923MCI3_9BURK|nr:response regulator [Ramlibacter albus]MBC5767656.1 response regulator [Ramlibacter albus]
MKARVLVVEDEAVIAADLENALAKLGYGVCASVIEGDEAVDAARTHRPDLVLMDIRLRGATDGVGAAARVRAELQIPVLFLSSHSDPATVERAKAAQSYGYLLKPFNPRELGTAIEVALARHATDRELELANRRVLELNLCLERRVRERTEELARYAADANGAREQERARVARDLHDALAQPLAALKLDVLLLRDELAPPPHALSARFDSLLSRIDGSIDETRRIACALRPAVLDELGLAAGLRWLVQDFTRRCQIPCTLVAPREIDLGEPQASTVFRIVQESLANVQRHSRAGHAHVHAVAAGGELAITVNDDGCGFDPGAPRRRESLGLVGLRERAALLRADLEIASRPGTGTSVRLHIPANPNLHAQP